MPDTPAPPPLSLRQVSLELSAASIAPFEQLTAAGSGCVPDSAVAASVDGTPAGSSVAGVDGSYRVALETATLAAGRHGVTVDCGGTASQVLSVVLVNGIGNGTAATTLIVLFLLTGVWFFGHRLLSPTQPKE
jgi:hypothetical protein